MSDAPLSITLSEWDEKGPDDEPALRSRFLDGSAATRSVTERLATGRLLDVTELRHGLRIRTFSHVGKIRVGNLAITVLPKIKGISLLRLLRYAYGMRRLQLLSETTHSVDQCSFEDLLISQLNAEVQELIARGLLRAYVATDERLSSPRGRIDLQRMALDGGGATATLPCRHYPRIEDTLLNQVLMAGLHLAAETTSSMMLGRESRRLASLLAEQVSRIRLNKATMELTAQKMNRLTTAYGPALSIIRLLVESRGIVLEGEAFPTTLPGFLFDMNAFFQALMSRFLRDNLKGYSIRDEHTLKRMMRYHGVSPLKRRAPSPRPDYAVMDGTSVRALLDAKYRDLWQNSLPPHMLYQLVVYAVSQQQTRQSAILYPTTAPAAKEVRIDVTDPVSGYHIGQVCLRPVRLTHLEELLLSDGAQVRSARAEYAKQLALGPK